MYDPLVCGYALSDHQKSPLLEIILHLKDNYKGTITNSVRKFLFTFTTPRLKVDDLLDTKPINHRS